MQKREEPMANNATDVVITRVWDWPVRLVHWAMVVLLIALVITAKMGGNAMDWHVRAGESMLALVLFRVVWGFVGTRHARFTNFVRGPGAMLRYARSVMRPPHEIHVGHNPVGGWMVIALLLTLLIQASTGLFSNDDIATDGPLARWISKDLSDSISGFHLRNAWVVVALASAHIAAVLLYLVALKENLIKPMLHGAKTLPAQHAVPADDRAVNVKAAVLFAACVGAVWAVVSYR